VVSGFEPVDLLQSILMLVNMISENRYGTEIQYKRAVTGAGNMKARDIVNAVFEPSDAVWRGLGNIPESGLKIRGKFAAFDASRHFSIDVPAVHDPSGCICGEVLRGLKKPDQCALFGTVCTPVNPVGACMVSGEGACQAYYQYR
jgi:hydrogenase expression/formation protein HypD